MANHLFDICAHFQINCKNNAQYFSDDGSWSEWEAHYCVSATARKFLRICNPPMDHDGSSYRCPADEANNHEAKTEECASINEMEPVCYNGACGCAKDTDADPKQPGDGSTQGSCDPSKTCYSIGVCRGNSAYQHRLICIWLDFKKLTLRITCWWNNVLFFQMMDRGLAGKYTIVNQGQQPRGSLIGYATLLQLVMMEAHIDALLMAIWIQKEKRKIALS